MASSVKTNPLSDAELADLDHFLLSEACGDDALPVDEAHGFLTALVVGPEALSQKEWLAQIWGQPRFFDKDQREYLTDLLVRMYENLKETLAGGGEFEPLVVEVEDDGELIEAYEGWCFGFMLGVAEHEGQWDVMPTQERTLMAPMSQLALLHGSEDDEELDMDEEEYRGWIELLPGAITGLYHYWHPKH